MKIFDSDLLLFATIVNSIFALLIMAMYLLIFKSFPNWCITVKNTFKAGIIITILHFGFWLLWIFPKTDNIAAVFFFILLTTPFFVLAFSSKEKFSSLKKLIAPFIINLAYIIIFLGIVMYLASQY